MKTIDTILGYVPIILMLGGAILYFLPASWVELPIGTATLGTAMFALGGVLLYAGWYDRFDTESDASTDDPTYKFDADSDAITDDTTSQTSTQPTGYLATVGNYGWWILIAIGATLSWGQLRNPERVGLIDRAPLELPWGEQPVLGFGFIVAGLALFVLIHIAIPYFNGD